MPSFEFREGNFALFTSLFYVGMTAVSHTFPEVDVAGLIEWSPLSRLNVA